MSYLVEAKNEFTIQIINALTPLIYDGLNSIYKEAMRVSKSNEILKMFQSFLKRIPKWSDIMIEEEKKRILNSVEYPDDILDLIKATVKSNIAILTFNGKSNNKRIDPKFYQNIDIGDFIHRIYIECAREIWNNPYLFYHIYEPIDLKRNQRDCFALIKIGIKEAIRKMLPRRFILETYLNEGLEDKTETNFEKILTENENKSVTKLVKQELDNGIYDDRNNFNIYNKRFEERKNSSIQNGGSRETATTTSTSSVRKIDSSETRSEKSFGSKILSIIDRGKATENLERKYEFIETGKNSSLSNNKNEEINGVEKQLTPIPNKSISNVGGSANNFKDIASQGSNIDTRIKDILNNDLGDSDLDETSVYNLEKDPSNYQEVFSNSVKEDHVNNIVNSTDRRKNLEKNQFFANYLRV